MGTIRAALLRLQANSPDRPPELTGRVISVVPDGPSALLTVRTNGGTLRERPSEALVYLLPESEVVYHDIPLTQQRPEAGMVAEIWLLGKSRDRVEFARLARDARALPQRPLSTVTLEAEEMDLRDVSARDLAGASQGKAIFFTKFGSRAKTTIYLKKGEYEVQVVLQGPKAKRESVTFKLAGKEFQICPEKDNALGPGTLREQPRVEIAIPNDGDYELRLEFAAVEVWVDRVLLVPKPR